MILIYPSITLERESEFLKKNSYPEKAQQKRYIMKLPQRSSTFGILPDSNAIMMTAITDAIIYQDATKVLEKKKSRKKERMPLSIPPENHFLMPIVGMSITMNQNAYSCIFLMINLFIVALRSFRLSALRYFLKKK